MSRPIQRRTSPFVGLVIGSAAAWLVSGHALAQSPPARALPTFAVDSAWPKVPERYKLGDISSIAIDAGGNAYVLHRPRTLKPEDAVKAAPAVVVLDPAGGFLRAWGGAGAGFEWPER